MTRDQFLLALQAVPEAYLAETDALLRDAETPTVRRRPLRRVLVAAAVAAALLLAAFTVAMAASEPFRETVREYVNGIFRVRESERVPEEFHELGSVGDVTFCGRTELDGVVVIDYYTVPDAVPWSLLSPQSSGTLYHEENGRGVFYCFSADGVRRYPTQHREQDYEFEGHTFTLVCDWVKTDRGYLTQAYVDGWREDCNLQFRNQEAGSRYLWLECYRSADTGTYTGGSLRYPLRYDVETGEVEDVLAPFTVEDGTYAETWEYAPNPNYLTQMWYQGDQVRYTLYDLMHGEVIDLAALFDETMPVLTLHWFDPYGNLMMGTYRGCKRYALEEQKLYALDLSQQYGDRDEEHFHDPDEGGLIPMIVGADWTQYFTMRYNEDRSRSLISLYDGREIRLPQEIFDENADLPMILTSPNGSKLLFYYSAPGGTYRLAVLDVETETFTILDREGFEQHEEYNIAWIDETSFAILTAEPDGVTGVSVYSGL